MLIYFTAAVEFKTETWNSWIEIGMLLLTEQNERFDNKMDMKSRRMLSSKHYLEMQYILTQIQLH
jgi:hypothetical protein